MKELIKDKNLCLSNFRNNLTSEHGENGVLLTISRKLNIKRGIGVEIGAFDGITSNNLYPFIFRNWKILYIEGQKDNFKKLEENTLKFKNVLRDPSFIKSGKDLNNILKKFNIPIDFDIFSLDIDNIDYWVWKDLTYEPKIVCMEYNFNLPEYSTVVKDCIPSQNEQTCLYGAHPLSISKLSEKKKYDLVSVTARNMIFIKSDINPFDKIDPYTFPYKHNKKILKEEDLKYITMDLEL